MARPFGVGAGPHGWPTLVAPILGVWIGVASDAPAHRLASVEARTADAPIRVLLVGNSLTEANDLPQMIEGLAAASRRPLDVTAATRGGTSLADHWSLGTPELVRRGGWTWVVLQQGPSALPESRVELRASTAKYAELARAHGPDAFHPSREGTYLAALVITAGLTGASPDVMPCELSLPSGARVSSAAAECAVLKRAAAEALSGHD